MDQSAGYVQPERAFLVASLGQNLRCAVVAAVDRDVLLSGEVVGNYNFNQAVCSGNLLGGGIRLRNDLFFHRDAQELQCLPSGFGGLPDGGLFRALGLVLLLNGHGHRDGSAGLLPLLGLFFQTAHHNSGYLNAVLCADIGIPDLQDRVHVFAGHGQILFGGV